MDSGRGKKIRVELEKMAGKRKSKWDKLEKWRSHDRVNKLIEYRIVNMYKGFYPYDNFAKLISDYPSLKFLFCRFSAESYSGADLKSGINALLKDWNKLVDHKVLKYMKGYIRNLDINDGGDFPHLHVIIALPSHAYAGKNHVSKAALAKAWKEVTHNTGECDIQPLKYAMFKTKYALDYKKPSDVVYALTRSYSYGCKKHNTLLKMVNKNQKRYIHGVFSDYFGYRLKGDNFFYTLSDKRSNDKDLTANDEISTDKIDVGMWLRAKLNKRLDKCSSGKAVHD